MKTLAQKLVDLIAHNEIDCHIEQESDYSTFYINGMQLVAFEESKTISWIDENGSFIKTFKSPLSALKNICK